MTAATVFIHLPGFCVDIPAKGASRNQNSWLLSVDNLPARGNADYCTISTKCSQILEILLTDEADKFSFELCEFLALSLFLARDA